jgi:hypothetical protein
MKKLFWILGFLAAAVLAQEVKQAGQKVTQVSPVTWTTGANAGKTRILFLGNSVYLDTSSSGQAGSWKRIDNTSDSCSNAFLLAADTNGATRSAGDYGLWGLVRSVDADSSTHLYRMQYRERVYNGTTKVPQFTPWTRVGANSIFNGTASPDTVAFPNAGTTSKISQFTLFSAPLGTLARFCPDDVEGTAGQATDSVFVDSLRVYAFAIPVDVKSVSSAAGGGGGAEGTVDLTGINGVAPSTGNGTAGTGTLRVAIASNNTAFSVNASAAGPAAHDAAASGNPVITGGVASAAAPTSVSADGDAVQGWYLRNGAQATVLTAAGALVGGDATNGLDVDVTRLNDGGSSITVDNGGTFATQVTSISAGNNNIGDVDIASGPTGASALQAQGAAAHDAAVAGNPVLQGFEARTSDGTAVANGDAVRAMADAFGKLVVLPGCLTENQRSGRVNLTDNTAADVIAAAGAGVKIAVYSVEITNAHATVDTKVEIRDGTTVKRITFAVADGGGSAPHGGGVPLFISTANTAVTARAVTTGSDIEVNVSGCLIRN